MDNMFMGAQGFRRGHLRAGLRVEVEWSSLINVQFAIINANNNNYFAARAAA